MIDFKEIKSPEDWELFSRDFFIEQGFFIESNPDRGPDGGKDMLISEDLNGNLNKYRFRWLVSCKHFAVSDRSVSESDEQNILERVKSFKADGFIGFYSTISSSGLNTRLNQLRTEKEIKDFKIFDHKIIESYLIRIGYSEILQRYFPSSYREVKPIQLVLSNYEPILCHTCGKDLLLSLYEEDYKANLVIAHRYEDGQSFVEDIYCVCKGECDRTVEAQFRDRGFSTGWQDISDLIIPAKFLSYVMSTLNNIRSGGYIYSDEAFEKEKQFIISLSQKVLRSTTQNEKDRIIELNKFGLF